MFFDLTLVIRNSFSVTGSQINRRVAHSAYFWSLALQPLRGLFTSCEYGTMITREISLFWDATPAPLVIARGTSVHISLSSSAQILFLVSCSPLVSLSYAIFCLLFLVLSLFKLPAVRFCTAGAKILVTQRTFCHSSLAILDALLPTVPV